MSQNNEFPQGQTDGRTLEQMTDSQDAEYIAPETEIGRLIERRFGNTTLRLVRGGGEHYLAFESGNLSVEILPCGDLHLVTDADDEAERTYHINSPQTD